MLRGVSLYVAPGERLALVGPTGAGKSTLAKLMARLYDPDTGSVRFGSVDLRDAALTSLRQRIVVVPQEGFLFDGTIADNLRLARPGASDDDVRAALSAIDALERFDAFPDGLDTEVRERGSRLSAGERQLVSLARAALVDPAVLVLDEATSSLDPGTEALVEHALDRLMRGRTTIVVAHRLSTVQRADRVAVVDHGELVELGTHEELLDLDGRYAALRDRLGEEPAGLTAARVSPTALQPERRSGRRHTRFCGSRSDRTRRLGFLRPSLGILWQPKQPTASLRLPQNGDLGRGTTRVARSGRVDGWGRSGQVADSNTRTNSSRPLSSVVMPPTDGLAMP